MSKNALLNSCKSFSASLNNFSFPVSKSFIATRNFSLGGKPASKPLLYIAIPLLAATHAKKSGRSAPSFSNLVNSPVPTRRSSDLTISHS